MGAWRNVSAAADAAIDVFADKYGAKYEKAVNSPAGGAHGRWCPVLKVVQPPKPPSGMAESDPMRSGRCYGRGRFSRPSGLAK
jgi:hypothetical protein